MKHLFFKLIFIQLCLLFCLNCYNRNLNLMNERIVNLETALLEIVTQEKIERNLRSDNKYLEPEVKHLDWEEDDVLKKYANYKRESSPSKKKKIEELITRLYYITKKKEGLIKNHYHIIRIDFKYLNEIYIPDEEIYKLERIRSLINNISHMKKKIIIYGFSCPQGTVKENLKVSSQRARNVALWFRKNIKGGIAASTIVYKGLGMYLTKKDLKEFTPEKKDYIKSKSRHVKIFIPKTQ